MNNNYHTQIDKSQGDNKYTNHNDNQNFANNQMLQMLMAQQQMAAQQPMTTQQPHMQTAPSYQDDMAEIELSETKSEINQKNEENSRPQQINEELRKMLQTNPTPQNNPNVPNPIPNPNIPKPNIPNPSVSHSIQRTNPDKPKAMEQLKNKPQTQTQSQSPPKPPTNPKTESMTTSSGVNVDEKDSNTTKKIALNYLIIPIVLLIVMIAVFHPKTSCYFDKYLPSSASLLGIASRGGIVIVVYIIVRLLGGFIVG